MNTEDRASSIEARAEQQRRALVWEGLVQAVWTDFVASEPSRLEKEIASRSGLKVEWHRSAKTSYHGWSGMQEGRFYWGHGDERMCFLARVTGLGIEISVGLLPFSLEGHDPHQLTLTVGDKVETYRTETNIPLLPVRIFFRENARGHECYYLWSGEPETAKLVDAIVTLLSGSVPASDFTLTKAQRGAGSGCASAFAASSSVAAVIATIAIALTS